MSSDDAANCDISVVILTYNEECNIRHALDSVTWSDDVIVIDSYSTDGTESICQEFSNVTFVSHSFVDLASQRQHAFDAGLVKHRWVLALDADEIVPPELASELITIASQSFEGRPVAYDTAMRYYMWGRWLKYSSEYPVYWRRFFREDAVRYVQAGHADKVEVDGPIGRTKHDLVHQDRHDLEHWLAKHNRYSTQEAEYALGTLSTMPLSDMFSTDRICRRRALKRIFRSLPCSDLVRFLYLYFWRWGFLDGCDGWRFCRLKAQQAYHVSLKMAERRQHKGSIDVSDSRTTTADTGSSAGRYSSNTTC